MARRQHHGVSAASIVDDRHIDHTADPIPYVTADDGRIIETPSYLHVFDSERQGGQWTMNRIADPVVVTGSETSSMDVDKQLEMEKGNEIQYRTCSWPKTASLLFSEYICLAIMSFPWSYSVLGLVPGLILTVLIAAIVLYTSMVIWEFCLRHPEVRDVCDIGQMLFWGKNWAWYFTAAMFLLNNTFIQGLHVLVGAQYINTMSDGNVCTVGFAGVAAVVCLICSLPRTFSTLAQLATASAIFTFVSVILAVIFAGVETHPAGYNTNGLNPTTSLYRTGEPIVRAFPAASTSFVSKMIAFLNISYTFIGQITIPSFIAEMRNPRDFPKALWAVTTAEIVVFGIVGSVVYAYVGEQYMTSPAFGSLSETYKKVAFSFMVPTIIFLGVLYASVSARFIFFRLFEGTRHKSSHTPFGWTAWTAILAALWLAAFLIAELIPFFSDLLSLMGSLFDSFFGFIFWGVAWIRMRKADYGPGWIARLGVKGVVGLAVNVGIIVTGLFFLTAGTYATVQSIIFSYESGKFGSVFSCRSNGL
ncbi:MAG: hypothetical protein M1817_006917 [Caeruleum heppii]|nr:MAG: hypothetical protein M1817_006917 [Caeruleum heppii]